MKTKLSNWMHGVLIVLMLILSLVPLLAYGCAPRVKVDDWKNITTPATSGPTGPAGPAGFGGMLTPPSTAPVPGPAMPAAQSAGTIGLAAGGAKDINNFRENIKNNFLPLPSDVTYEGLFYDYYFDTGNAEPSQKLFYPAYSYAATKDPFSGNTDYYLSVGLNSGMKESDFQRKKLNLVIVLDISGSMGSPFNRYYYDQFGQQVTLNDSEAGKTKIQVATESIVALLGHLNADDRFGMVVFTDGASLAKPLDLVGKSDMNAIKNHILEIRATNGTNLESGMKMGSGLYQDLANADPAVYENRIIFLTDAQPNMGDTSQNGFFGMLKANADNKIYTTIIGIGVDFNTQLVDYITKVKGANYYSVHSSEQFKQRMDTEFEYMVTPLVFNLQLTLQSDGWAIEKVYGSPEANEATGELMKVNTLFPSKREADQTKGGVILLKLKKTGPTGGKLTLKVSYEDRNGKPDSSEKVIEPGGQPAEYFENDGIRKAVLLSRYADLLKNWMIDERANISNGINWEPTVNALGGILVPPTLGQWERQSVSLRVAASYHDLFQKFQSYFKSESAAIGDETLVKETDVLQLLINR